MFQMLPESNAIPCFSTRKVPGKIGAKGSGHKVLEYLECSQKF